MKFLLYLLQCLVECFGAFTGAGTLSSNDGLIGVAVFAIIVCIFIAAMLVLERFTKLKMWKSVLCSVGIVLGIILIFCAVCILVES